MLYPALFFTVAVACGLSIIIIVSAILGSPVIVGAWITKRRVIAAALVAAVGSVVFLATDWVIAPVLVLGAALYVPSLIVKPQIEQHIELLEDIDRWLDGVRDHVSTNQNLRTAVANSALSANPDEPFGPALMALSERLSDPTATLEQACIEACSHVNASGADIALMHLASAEQLGKTGLAAALVDIQEQIRNQIDAYQRVQAAGASVAQQAKFLPPIVVANIVLILFTNRSMVESYAQPTGQIVLAVLASLFAGAIYLFNRLTTIRLPRPIAINPSAMGGGSR